MRRVLIPLLLLVGCACGVHDGRLNVILIVVDTLRADALGCYGAAADPTPQIDRLALRGVRFDRCISQAPWTLPSITTIMTGRYPSSHGAGSFVSVLPEDLRTMTKDFRGAGYVTSGVVSHRFLTKKKGFARGFQFFDESNNRNHDYISSRGVSNVALRWLKKRSESKPFFLFLHYFDPHYNYKEHEEFTTITPYDGPLHAGMDIWEIRESLQNGPVNENDIRYLRELYDGEVRYLDSEIGRVLNYLDENDLFKKSVVVFTSDHGEEFMEHGWLGHTRNLHDNLLRVPLIICAPKLPGRTARDDPAMLIDLYSTMEKLAGLDPPANFGIDLFGEQVSGRACIAEVDFNPETTMKARPAIIEREKVKHTEMRAVERGEWKAIEDRLTGEWELFHVGEDRDEMKDRASSHPDTLQSLQLVLDEWEKSIEQGATETEVLDSSQIEELRSLGYVQ